MKQRHDHSGRPEADAVLIERLLFQAGVARRARSSISQREAWRGATVIEDCDAARVASLILEDVLASDLGSSANCATYLARVVSLQHMAIPCLNVLMTSIDGVELTPLAGRGLAVALCEILFHAGGGASNTGSVDLQLAVGIDGRHLVIGLVAHGSVQPVASTSATVAMMRAIDIVSTLRGQFVRAYEPGKTTFAIIFPYRDVGVGGATERVRRGQS